MPVIWRRRPEFEFANGMLSLRCRLSSITPAEGGKREGEVGWQLNAQPTEIPIGFGLAQSKAEGEAFKIDPEKTWKEIYENSIPEWRKLQAKLAKYKRKLQELRRKAAPRKKRRNKRA